MNILSSPRILPDGTQAPMNFAAKAALTAGLTVPFIAVLGTVYYFWRRLVGPTELALFAFFYAYTVFGMTVGFHRLLTHRAFETGPVVKFLLAVGGTMCLQGPVILWVAIHRRHHQVSDREGDPHSPHLHGDGWLDKVRGFWHAHIGWLYHPDPVDMVRSVPDMMNDPIIRFVDRTAYFWFFLGLALPTGIAYAIKPTLWSALSGFIWGGLVRIFFMHHATFCVNSICHVFGTRPFQSCDHSANNPAVAIISFGEGWHNNHHAFPTSARHGLRWYQFDLSWICIRCLQLLGLAWDVRVPSESAIQAKLKTAA